MNITTIIPVHELDDSTTELFKIALDSVSKQNKFNVKEYLTLNIVVTPLSIDKVKAVVSEKKLECDVNIILNEGDGGFQSQINKGAESCKTQYFTILEFDDELSETYYFNVVKHINYYSNVDIFLPMVVETNDKNQVLKLTNETVWSRSFVGENGELGYLNSNSLNQYTDFKICGAIIKTNEYINSGMLKTNIELTFQYEFLLRMITNGSNIYTIPKIGCKHIVTREGSLFDTYSKTLNKKQIQFWFNTAKKEANFQSDREIDTSELLSVSK